MIKPNKYTNIDLCVVNIGGVILKSLYSCPIQTYEELENLVANTYGESAKVVFINALSFLYLLGLIEYQPSTDTITLINNEIK